MKNNIEIEIKTQVSEETFLNIEDYLKKEGKFIKSTFDVDEYYTPIHKDFLGVSHPYEGFRISQRGETTKVNYKKLNFDENDRSKTYCDEYETVVESKEQLERILEALDFKRIVEVRKHRSKYSYDDQFEICLDKVENLGFFIEIEGLIKNESIENVNNKIYDFARRLGIGEVKKDKRGYPQLLMDKLER